MPRKSRHRQQQPRRCGAGCRPPRFPFSRVLSGTIAAPRHRAQRGDDPFAAVGRPDRHPVCPPDAACDQAEAAARRAATVRQSSTSRRAPAGPGHPPSAQPPAAAACGNGGRQRMEHQATSNSPAAPMPPATHIETTTYLTPRRLPSISAWPTRREPVMPNGMADGDAAAVDVELVRIDAQLLLAIDGLAGERLVDLEQADIVNASARRASAAWGSRRPGRCPFRPAAACHLEPAIDAKHRQPFLLRGGQIHHHLRRCAIGQLRGIAGRDVLAFLDTSRP
jgi:hypothetical protein